MTWVKGADDGINGFDVELMRLSQDGLILIAKNGESALAHRFIYTL